MATALQSDASGAAARTPAAPSPTARLSVGVLVDLFRYPAAGGHVKCWERLAEAALGLKGLDLTVYFLAEKPGNVALGENARYVLLRPLMGTDRLRFLKDVVDHTDLAPFRPGFHRTLASHHVVHATDAFFTLAKSALSHARRSGRPLVCSLHTDTPSYAREQAAMVFRKLFGATLSGLVVDRWRWHERIGGRMQRQLRRYLQHCDWSLASQGEDLSLLQRELPGRVSTLRRGIDKQRFHPERRDRGRLSTQFGIPEDCLVLLCVGRVDEVKSVLTLAQAARLLVDRGVPAHVVFAGEGRAQDEIRQILGAHVTLPGNIPQEDLAWIYASSDLFVFPSRIEISPNVVLEAKAAGLPVMVARQGGSSQFVKETGRDGLVIAQDDRAVWAEAIQSLWSDPARRTAIAAEARRWIENERPSWREVLVQDLVPVWQRVACERGVWS
ncbi:MAG TPA: glycosyltransferase [Terriglobales bacterium]|nr:glycosyltransferase [Terriglobales bacterium]